MPLIRRTRTLPLVSALDTFLGVQDQSGILKTVQVTRENAAAMLLTTSAFANWNRAKITLTNNMTLFVRADATGAGDGLVNNAAGALQSRQAAWDYIVKRLIIPRGLTVTVQCTGAQTDTLVTSGCYEGDGAVLFLATRANILSAAGASVVSNVPFLAQDNARFSVAGFDLNGAAYGLWSIFGGKINHYFNVFTGGPIHSYSTRYGYIQMDGDTGVQANAQNHGQSSHYGNLRRNGGTVVALADHAYSVGFLYADQGEICITGPNPPGPFNANGKAVTGFKWLVQPSTSNQQWFGADAADLATILGNAGPIVQDGGSIFTGTTDIDRGKYGQAWTPYTPSIAVGSGALGTGNTFAARYRNQGKSLQVQFKAALGASGVGSATGQLVMGLPTGFLSRDDTGGGWFTRTADFAAVQATIGASNNLVTLRVANAFPLGNSQTLQGTFTIETL